MLLHERRLGGASRVAGYVQQLPRNFDTLLHWSPAEREALQYPHLVNEVSIPCCVSKSTYIYHWTAPNVSCGYRAAGLACKAAGTACSRRAVGCRCLHALAVSRGLLGTRHCLTPTPARCTPPNIDPEP